MLLEKMLLSSSPAADSAYAAQLERAAASLPADTGQLSRIDTSIARDSLFSLLDAPHPLTHARPKVAGSWDWLQPSPEVQSWMATGLGIMVALVAFWVIWKLAGLADKQLAENRQLRDRAEQAERQVYELRGKERTTERLVNERDRLFQEYVFMLQPFITDEQYKEWRKANWKSFARNAFALTALVRPLHYHDLRNRIRANSPSLGQNLPTLAAKAWLHPEPAPANWPFGDFDEYELPPIASSASTPLGEQPAVWSADEVTTKTTILPN